MDTSLICNEIHPAAGHAVNPMQRYGEFVGRMVGRAVRQGNFSLSRTVLKRVGKRALVDAVAAHDPATRETFYRFASRRIWQAFYAEEARRDALAERKAYVRDAVRSWPKRERELTQMLWGDDPLNIKEAAAVFEIPVAEAQAMAHGILAKLFALVHGDRGTLPPLAEVVGDAVPALRLAGEAEEQPVPLAA